MTQALRPARPADLDELFFIEQGCPTAPPWSISQLERGLDSKNSRLLVLEEEGRILGFGSLLLVPPEAEVATIVIRREEQGRGLGRALLHHLIETARGLGCATLKLEVGATNAPAVKLYESAGFRTVGKRPRYYDDGSDALLMDLTIESA